MEALLAAMGGIGKQQSQFPCLPFVAYALMKGMDFNKYEPEGDSGTTHIVEQRQWAIPDFSTVDFYAVPQDITYLIHVSMRPAPHMGRRAPYGAHYSWGIF